MAEHETFETERLLLRKITLDDAEEIFEYASDPEVTRYMSYEAHKNLETTLAKIVEFFIHKRPENWGIVYKADNKLIGSIDLRIDGDQADFGWTLHRAYWGQGLVAEAASALRDFAFNTLELNVLVAEHNVENTQSGRVMSKLGMRKIGHLWLYVAKLDKSVLTDYWAITREEYDNLGK